MGIVSVQGSGQSSTSSVTVFLLPGSTLLQNLRHLSLILLTRAKEP